MAQNRPGTAFLRGSGAAAALAFALWAAAPAFAEGEAPVTPLPGSPAFDAAVREYLIAHPEVVVEALERYQAKQRAAEAESQRRAVAGNLDQLLADKSSPILGNPEGDVTVVEFFDYRCPYCRKVAEDLRRTVAEDGNVKLVMKEWPILGPQSLYAAQVALAAHRQGKYEAFHFAMMTQPGDMTEESVLALAESLGLDRERLIADLQHPEIEAALRRNFELADALKLGGTPAFVVGEELVPGAVDAATLKRLIGKARKPAG